MKRSPTILLCGCPLNSGNNGLTALALSTIRSLISLYPDCHIIIQHNSGKDAEIKLSFDNREVLIEPVFFHASNRYAETKGLKLANLLSLFMRYTPRPLKSLLSARIPLFSALERADFVLDISGGDSFTSIYGEEVFKNITVIKKIVIRMGLPLILLPQSYGPFTSARHRSIARTIFESSKLISCRDESGPEDVLALSSELSNQRIVTCPDVAFSLEPDSSRNDLINDHFARIPGKKRLRVGLNISGLLYTKIIDFKFACNYRELIEAIVRFFANDLDAEIVLIPHVVATSKTRNTGQSIETTDTVAIDLAMETFEDELRQKILVLPEIEDPRVLKGLIGECDYFLGSRMHACIAAISQSVPTTCLAYSDKFLGVMKLAGIADSVADMRQMEVVDIMLMIERLYADLERERHRLGEINKNLKDRIKGYFRDSLSSVDGE